MAAWWTCPSSKPRWFWWISGRPGAALAWPKSRTSKRPLTNSMTKVLKLSASVSTATGRPWKNSSNQKTCFGRNTSTAKTGKTNSDRNTPSKAFQRCGSWTVRATWWTPTPATVSRERSNGCSQKSSSGENHAAPLIGFVVAPRNAFRERDCRNHRRSRHFGGQVVRDREETKTQSQMAEQLEGFLEAGGEFILWRILRRRARPPSRVCEELAFGVV